VGVAAGGGLLHAKGHISLPAAVVAPGLMVLAIPVHGRSASAAQNVGTIGALGAGGYVALAGLWSALSAAHR